MKEKLSKYKISTFIFWVISVYAIFLSIYCILFNNTTSLTQLLFVFALACFVYLDIVLLSDYIKVNRTLKDIKEVAVKYKYFETYVSDNNLVIEILKEEKDEFKKDLSNLQIQVKGIGEDEKFAKYVVDLKQ